jgi:signal transduction histidine kinase
MKTNTQRPLPSPEAVRLLSFLKYDIPAAAGGALLCLTVGAVFAHVGLLILGLVILGDVALLLWARRQVARDRVREAAIAISGGIWIISVFLAFVSFAFIVFPLLLIFSVLVALPYVSKNTLRRMVVTTACMAVIVMPSALILDLFQLGPFRQDVIPDLLVVIVLAVGLPINVGLILLLMWQHSAHLIENLAQIQAANEASRASEQTLAVKLQELQESRSRIVAAQEGIRRQIAAHIHGRVQGKLLVLKGQLQQLLGKVTHPPETARTLEEVIDQLGQVTQEELSEISRQLYPAILRRGLVPALHSLGRQFQGAFRVELVLSEELMRQEQAVRNLIPEAVRLAAYRIAEEALANVVKHASASQVILRLDLRPNSGLHLLVGDNGRGFDPTAAPAGLGMAAIQDYAGAVGGSCAIRSAPGQGAEVRATLPLVPMPAAGLPETVAL